MTGPGNSVVRQAVPGDVPALAAFARRTYEAAFGHSFSRGDLERHLSTRLSDGYFVAAVSEDVFLLAETAEGIVGFVQFGDAHQGEFMPGDQELRRIYVSPAVQNRGIGSLLLETTLAHSRMRTAGAIFLDVWEENHRARALYERYGFVVVGKRAFVPASGQIAGFDLVMTRWKPL